MDVQDFVNRNVLQNISFVKEVMFSSILVKRNLNLSNTIQQVNQFLSEMYGQQFSLSCNNNVTRNHLWKDGIYFTKTGTGIF